LRIIEFGNKNGSDTKEFLKLICNGDCFIPVLRFAAPQNKAIVVTSYASFFWDTFKGR